MQHIRGKHISMVFQEPMTSLNPSLTVGTQIIETIIKHEKVTKAEAWKRAKELLDIVQIPMPSERLRIPTSTFWRDASTSDDCNGYLLQS